MLKRVVIVVLGVMAAAPAFAEELKPTEARKFIAGKLFAFNCFEGTRGSGRIFNDGSVAGSVQIGGSGPAAQLSSRSTSPGSSPRSPRRPCKPVRGISERLARRYQAQLGLRVLEVPVKLRPYALSLVWHPRLDGDAGQRPRRVEGHHGRGRRGRSVSSPHRGSGR